MHSAAKTKKGGNERDNVDMRQGELQEDELVLSS